VVILPNLEAMKKLQASNPEAAARINSYIVRMLAERLARANRELARYH